MRFEIVRGTQENTLRWEMQGSPPDYPVLADSPVNYQDEAAARSGIAVARRAMSGYKFAKVVVDSPAEV